ncbi:hypothetical protein ZIOFF_065159 [Zingiber officinale]|uniref:Pentatricopeptide repeat-containing protein n=1 Tax=Zingiber officinale TaxID=94328 RepID=A0A8J5F1B6_ZINOF|nr:hypothetical protein ZIOFF_065159 [Zingiber officinale]
MTSASDLAERSSSLEMLSWLPRIGLAGDVYLRNTMMEVYARNGRVPLARRLFEEMPFRDVVTWTSLLSSYVSTGDSPEAFHLFCQMRAEGLEVNQVTMAVLL